MKKTLFLFFAVFLGVSVDAKRISLDEATIIAADFFGESSTTLRNETLRQASSNNNGYYIFTSRNNDAFVIVSSDTRMPQVLAYSRDNGWDIDNIPPQLPNLLNVYSKIYEYVTEKGIDISFSTVNKSIPIKYRTQEWGQGEPFNTLCPTAFTGCSATAMAIKMKYHNYPERGTGSYSYYTSMGQNLTMDFDFDINFNLMDTNYNFGQYTKAQADAVAKLMYACGVALGVEYGPNGSSARVSGFVKMAKYFGYSNDIKVVKRSCYSDKEWFDLLNNELDNNGPVIYVGFDDTNTDGHTFLIDGRNHMGMYHINWGWYGRGNGYFRMDLLTPLELNYSYYHNMVINARPASSVGKMKQIIKFSPK